MYRIELNLVHDPQEEDDNDNIECQELGTANLKLIEVSTTNNLHLHVCHYQ